MSDYYDMGLVSAAVNRHYGTLKASQREYAVLVVATGLCVGVATNPFQGEALSLQSCTNPDRTVRIIGTALSPTAAAAGRFSIISGATSDFSHPFAMSYPRHLNTNEMFAPTRWRRSEAAGAIVAPAPRANRPSSWQLCARLARAPPRASDRLTAGRDSGTDRGTTSGSVGHAQAVASRRRPPA